MNKIVVDLATGTQSIVPLTQSEVDEITNRPPKSQAEIDTDTSNAATAKLTQLRASIFPDMLTFLATLPGAPPSIKAAAIVAAAEKAKVKP